jgi:hypothetical protein
MCVVQAATCSLDKTVRLWDLRTQQSATLCARTCLRRRPASESVRPLSDRALPQLLLPIADLLVSTALMQCIATHSAHQVPQWSLTTMPFPPRAVGLSRNCMHRRVLRVRWCASTARRAKAPTRNRAIALHRARQAEPWCVAISHTLSGLVVSADARGAVGVWRPVAASASAAAQSSSAGEKPRTLCPQGGVAAIKAIAASPADVRVAPAVLPRGWQRPVRTAWRACETLLRSGACGCRERSLHWATRTACFSSS